MPEEERAPGVEEAERQAREEEEKKKKPPEKEPEKKEPSFITKLFLIKTCSEGHEVSLGVKKCPYCQKKVKISPGILLTIIFTLIPVALVYFLFPSIFQLLFDIGIWGWGGIILGAVFFLTLPLLWKRSLPVCILIIVVMTVLLMGFSTLFNLFLTGQYEPIVLAIAPFVPKEMLEGLRYLFYGWQEEEEVPTYTGYKSYESLDVILGDELIDKYGNKIYRIPTPYASKTKDEPPYTDGEPYALSFYVENKNKYMKIFDIDVMNVRGSANKSAKDPFWFKATVFDACRGGYACDLEPNRKIKVYAEHFKAKNKEGDLLYDNMIPCEVDDLEVKNLEFEIEVKYKQNVSHKRTLIITRSYKDTMNVMKNPKLQKEATMQPPTDGPIDLLIDFTNPYTMGERKTERIRLEVHVINEGEGEYKPWKNGGCHDKDKPCIIIQTVDPFPSWINLSNSTYCELYRDDDKIEITLEWEAYREGNKKFICDLEVKDYPTQYAYQSVHFTGQMFYRYKETYNSFPSVKVDRSDCEEA